MRAGRAEDRRTTTTVGERQDRSSSRDRRQRPTERRRRGQRKKKRLAFFERPARANFTAPFPAVAATGPVYAAKAERSEELGKWVGDVLIASSANGVSLLVAVDEQTPPPPRPIRHMFARRARIRCSRFCPHACLSPPSLALHPTFSSIFWRLSAAPGRAHPTTPCSFFLSHSATFLLCPLCCGCFAAAAVVTVVLLAVFRSPQPP